MSAKKSKSSTTWTVAQVLDHARRHGQDPKQYLDGNDTLPRATIEHAARVMKQAAVFKEPAGPKMNKTEARYGRILESRLQRRDILRYRFNAVRLLWGDCMRYLPDFSVTNLDGSMLHIEVKGPHIRDRDRVRFKGCKAEYPEFRFEMWQETRQKEWVRVY